MTRPLLWSNGRLVKRMPNHPTAPKKYAKAGDDDDGGDGDDDDDDDCDELSDAEDEPKGFANHYFKMGGNATTSGRTPSVPSTQSNSYKPTARYSPAPGYSGSRNGQSTSSKGWYTSPTRPPNVASYSSYSQSSSSSSYSQSSTHSQYGENGSAGSYHGKATFFSQDGNPGACGKTHQDSDYIVAIQSEMYEGGKFCGKTVVVTRKSTGQSIRCIAADACPGCPSNQSLDLSIAAFNALGKAEEGVFDITWDVVD